MLIRSRIDSTPGAVTPITRAHLYAADNDTEPEGIVYRVGQTTHGDVSLIAASTGAAMKNFTQADINLQQVIFILQGLFLFFYSWSSIVPIINVRLVLFLIAGKNLLNCRNMLSINISLRVSGKGLYKCHDDMYTYICIGTCMHTYIHVCKHTYTNTYLNTSVHAYIHTVTQGIEIMITKIFN